MPDIPEQLTFQERAIFAKASIDVVVPVLAEHDDGSDGLQRSRKAAEQRDLLIYDELVTFDVRLSSESSEDELAKIATHVDLTVTAQLSGHTAPSDARPDTSHENVVKLELGQVSIVAGSITPFICNGRTANEAVARWQGQLHLRQPERHLYRPMVQFSIVASLSEKSRPSLPPIDDDYLPSGIPLPENLLQQLRIGTGSDGPEAQLPASRIEKVVPRSLPTAADMRPLRNSSRPCRIVPMVAARLQHSIIADSVLVSLEIEALKWADAPVTVERVTASVDDKQIEGLHPVTFPHAMSIGDRSGFIFKVPVGASTMPAIVIQAHADLTTGCTPRIKITRTPRGPMNITKSSSSAVIRHWQRPASQTITRPISTAAHDEGVSLTISAPGRVKRGSKFHLKIFIVNRSLKKRRLAFVALTESQNGRGPAPSMELDKDTIAPAVMDDMTLYKVHQSSYRDHMKAQIMCMSPDVKVGPLIPGACHETQLDFVAMSAGVVVLEALRIIDLDTRETVSVTELPDVVVVDNDQVD